MTVVIEKIANDINFVGEMIGHVYETTVLDSNDTMHILSVLCDVIASCDDARITFK